MLVLDPDQFALSMIQAKQAAVRREKHLVTTAEQLRLTGKSASIMLEPIGRDTAPALTLAAFRLVAGGNDAVMTVMPADHAVADLPRFHAAVAAGVHCAMQGKIATIDRKSVV